MKRVYKAHINDKTKEIQTVKCHSENTAELSAKYAVSELKDIMYAIGLLHDLGKFQESFQKRIDGANLKIEHSICGALTVKERYSNPLGLLMEYCIAGHHSGIPNGGYPNDTSDMPTLSGRLQRKTEDFMAYQKELVLPQLDSQNFLQYLVRDCGESIDLVVDKFAFLTRYCFSCLTDADSIDTAGFCGENVARQMRADFSSCLKKVDEKLSSFVCKTSLQKARAELQQQVFSKIRQDAELYLMNMPTGSGKTLCSVKFALERAIRKGKKRIIYIIPYNSIIDQTAKEFTDIFGESAEILRHQSTFVYEEKSDDSEDYCKIAKRAAENWDAPFIITTAVQFFESIYANKRGKLRKFHNMGDSMLIFDEAHLMPTEYLQPCLRAIAYIARYLNSEAVFLTATMPDFVGLMKQYALPDSKILSLIDDTSAFTAFGKCQYIDLGKISGEALLKKAFEFPSTLIIVNKRATAKQLFKMCGGKKYHLSTYVTSYDRERVLSDIKTELKQLEEDFPDLQDVPQERRITVISTSLIEAGVDLDMFAVFRELAGLDNILQAGGRCNREGKRREAETYIFELEDAVKAAFQDEQANIVKGLLEQYSDISCLESIEEYYERLYVMKKDAIQQHTISQECTDIKSIPFQTYADQFEIINAQTISIVVPRDEKSRKLIETLRYAGSGIARELQLYTCSVYRWELDDLVRQHVVDDFGTGIYCLTNEDYYNEESGILFEAKDYLIE